MVSNNISHNGFNTNYDIQKMVKFSILVFFKKNCEGFFFNLKIFMNIIHLKMESSKLKNFSLDLCWSCPYNMLYDQIQKILFISQILKMRESLTIFEYLFGTSYSQSLMAIFRITNSMIIPFWNFKYMINEIIAYSLHMYKYNELAYI